ncbi:hypothetical protein ACIPO9_17495 [Pseudomonas sp. NPDC090203]|uniref:oxidoreductase n=1 Tax=Pseudomonas sp. NPDC090203 TaxID=3364477 RepID=UPI0038172FD2
MLQNTQHPFQLGNLALCSGYVHSSPTPAHALDPGYIPNQAAVAHFTQLARKGLVVAAEHCGALGARLHTSNPNYWNAIQEAGWQRVTDAVHASEGRIFGQLAHLSTVTHFDGLAAPAGMTRHDIQRSVSRFRDAGALIKTAGFDGLEVNVAPTTMLAGFLDRHINARRDSYGAHANCGLRFLFEILAVLTDCWGPDRIGLRLRFDNAEAMPMMSSEELKTTLFYLGRSLGQFDLAYVNISHTGRYQSAQTREPQDISATLWPLYKGVLLLKVKGDAQLHAVRESEGESSVTPTNASDGCAYILRTPLIQSGSEQTVIPIRQPIRHR